MRWITLDPVFEVDLDQEDRGLWVFIILYSIQGVPKKRSRSLEF